MDSDKDPYDTGREAARKMLEVLEGEVVESAQIEDTDGQYPRVEMLLSEYPIQEFECCPKYLKVDDEMSFELEAERGDRIYLQRPVLEDVEEIDTPNGHALSLEFKTTEEDK